MVVLLMNVVVVVVVVASARPYPVQPRSTPLPVR